MKDLNLIPKSYFLKEKEKTKRIYKLAGAFIILVILASAIIVPIRIMSSYSETRDNLKIKLQETSRLISTINQLNTIKSMYNSRQNEEILMSKEGIKVYDCIAEIKKALPEKLFVVNLSMSGAENGGILISLDCFAATEGEIASFTNHLRKNNYFYNVELSDIKKMQTGSQSNEISPVINKNNKPAKVTLTSGYYSFNINITLT